MGASEVRPASRGFTLIEMVVTLALLMLGLFLAAELLQESGGLLAASVERLQDPLPGLLAARLRSDLQSARRAQPPAMGNLPFWTGEDLRLDLLDEAADGAARTVYTWQGTELRRRAETADGALLDEATWLRGVVSWRWRRLATRLVEVEVSYHTAAPLDSRDTRLGPGTRREPVTRTEHLRIAVRGGGRARGW